MHCSTNQNALKLTVGEGPRENGAINEIIILQKVRFFLRIRAFKIRFDIVERVPDFLEPVLRQKRAHLHVALEGDLGRVDRRQKQRVHRHEQLQNLLRVDPRQAQVQVEHGLVVGAEGYGACVLLFGRSRSRMRAIVPKIAFPFCRVDFEKLGISRLIGELGNKVVFDMRIVDFVGIKAKYELLNVLQIEHSLVGHFLEKQVLEVSQHKLLELEPVDGGLRADGL